MKKLKLIYSLYSELLKKGQLLTLLTIRVILAYGFYEPAMNKLKNISGIVEWFESMEIPFPTLNAYLSAYTELLGVILLLLGLGVRLISVPLIIVMIVAIKTVHWENGFAAGDNGFEIPLYYMIMLFTLLTHGGGRFSIDYPIQQKNKLS